MAAYAKNEDLGVELTKRISWGAVFAGVATALGVSLVFGLLGAAFGAGSLDFLEENQPFSGLATGTVIWAIVSNILALFAGGYVAGRLAGRITRVDHALHGVITWSVASLAMVFVVTATAGSVIQGAFGLVGDTASMLTQGVPKAIQNNPMVSQLKAAAEQEVEQTQAQIREQIAENPEQAKTQALRAADEAASALSTASTWSAVCLILSAVAAAFGGLLGAAADTPIGYRETSILESERLVS